MSVDDPGPVHRRRAEQTPASTRRVTPELLIGISAILLSLGALVVSVVQTNIIADQQQASVWPRLQIGGYHFDDNYSVVLKNAGVGPALVHHVEFSIRGKRYPSVWALANGEVMTAMGDSLYGTGRYFGDLQDGTVVSAGEEIELLSTQRNELLAGRLDALVSDTSYHARVVYADVFGRCWALDNKTVRKTERCGNEAD